MSFKISRWGPRKLREIFGEIESALNQVRPVEGIGIAVDVTKNGSQISTKEAQQNQKQPGQQSTGGGSGTPVDLYGAFNGAPALFHLSQTSPPTPL